MSDTAHSHPKAPHTPQPVQRATNVLAVASGKGGVGKTWVSSTLAHALAFEGERVLLFDGDLGLANVDVQLGLAPARDLAAVIAGQAQLGEAITKFEGGAPKRGGAASDREAKVGFDVIAGRSGSGALAGLSRTELGALTYGIRLLAGHYDRVIVDLAAGVDSAVAALSNTAATVFVVLTEEPTSLTDAYAFIKLSTMKDKTRDVRVVVNQASSDKDGRRTYETLAKATGNFLGLTPKLAGVVRRDPKVGQAIRSQTSILTRYPQADASKDIGQLAKSLR